MKKIFKLGLLAMLVLAMAVAAVGCGGSGAKETAKQEPAKDAAKKKLIVGSDTTFAPFEFMDNGKPVGFDVDLISALCQEAGYELDFRSMSFDGLIPALQTSQIDAAVSSMSITDERKQVINFTDPYYKSGLAIAVQEKNTTINKFDDLKGKKVAVQSGTTGANMAEKVTDKDKITYFTNTDQALLDLANGNVDAVINDYPVSQYYAITAGQGKVKLVGERLTAEDYGIGVPKDKKEVVEKLNAALKKIKENGKYAEIYKKWFKQDPPK